MTSRRRLLPEFGPTYGDPRLKKFAGAINNFRHPKTFPGFKDCAPYQVYSPGEDQYPGRHWCFLGEITEGRRSVDSKNVLLFVKDKDDQIVPVALAFPKNDRFDYDSVKIGFTIAVLYAEQTNLPDESAGMGLEHSKFVKIFPCNLETLLRINDDIEAETPVDCLKKCKACGKEELLDLINLRRCSRCVGASYCGSECQKAAWEQGHKRECKIFASARELQRSRLWESSYATEWVGFGQREKDMAARDKLLADPSMVIQPEWKIAEAVTITDLQGTFAVKSGMFAIHLSHLVFHSNVV
ncbi:hypothetical protein GGX14DRAFT_347143 [Mycena pura]|uniref:MYND-type domain-containing protein n=1 Tax=Mycena pura TaxID=153505 RepID=A0AAD7E3I7_9AGAR|nr:hypothetical protein GGX14DRAFT_347143 [Mycena pura]